MKLFLPVSLAFSFAVCGAAPATHEAALSFGDSAQYDGNFHRVLLSHGSDNRFEHSGGKLVHSAQGSGTVVFIYDTHPDGTPENLFRDVVVGFDFSTNTRNVAFGIYFGGESRRKSSLALFNMNTNTDIRKPGANLTVRFFTGCNLFTGAAGTPIGSVCTLSENSFAADTTIYRATFTITYVTDTTAKVVLTISDPINPLATFEASSEEIPVAPGGGEIAFRSGFLSGGGVNTIDNITIGAVQP